MYFIIFVISLFVIYWIWKLLKVPKCGNMVLTTGGVKTGKSTLSVRLVYKTWKKQKLKVSISNFFLRILKFLKIKKFADTPFKEKPMIYSNIPLNIEYVPLTEELLKRENRFAYGSVIYVCESSLVADSMTFKDDYINEQMLLFNKLIAHSTKGGYIFYDTQAIGDNHYAIKRCLSTYFYIHHAIKIPFFILMFVRELKYSDDNSAVNTFEADVEEGLKLVIVPKSTWKLFDCYCYSVLTDHLPLAVQTVKPKSLKADKIISFKKYKNLKGGDKKNGENK